MFELLTSVVVCVEVVNACHQPCDTVVGIEVVNAYHQIRTVGCIIRHNLCYVSLRGIKLHLPVMLQVKVVSLQIIFGYFL